MPAVKPAHLRPFVGAYLAALGALGGCQARLPGPPACDASRACSRDAVCVVGRCREPGTIPVSTLAQRVQLTPRKFKVIGERSIRETSAKHGGFSIHADSQAETTLLLEWVLPATFRERAPAIERAVVVFEPLAHLDARGGQLSVEVANILEPWRLQKITAKNLPRTALLMRLGVFPAAPMQALSLDVTELVREWLGKKRLHGLMFVASGTGGVRAWYSSEASGRVSPRLDLYLAPVTDARILEQAAAAAMTTAKTKSTTPKDEALEGDDGAFE